MSYLPYVEFRPGDSIQADALNTMQGKIQDDIQKQIEAVKQELRCPKRYFLDMEVLLAGPPQRLQPAVLIHDLGCNPIVQVYELQEIIENYVFCVCAPAEFNDPEAMDFVTKSFDERHWGDNLDLVVKQVASAEVQQKKFKRTFTLSAWIRNLQEMLFEPGPAQYHFNMGDVRLTQWVHAREEKTVEELDNQGEWPPRFVYRPRLVNNVIVAEGGEMSDSPKKGGVAGWVRIGIFHVNLSEAEIAPETAQRTRLMVLLGS
jgi:hypothetical protein